MRSFGYWAPWDAWDAETSNSVSVTTSPNSPSQSRSNSRATSLTNTFQVSFPWKWQDPEMKSLLFSVSCRCTWSTQWKTCSFPGCLPWLPIPHPHVWNQCVNSLWNSLWSSRRGSFFASLFQLLVALDIAWLVATSLHFLLKVQEFVFTWPSPVCLSLLLSCLLKEHLSLDLEPT